MSFLGQQNLLHYLNDNSRFTPSFTRSSPYTILPHHQEQHLQMSPGKLSLPPTSPSLSINSSRAAPGVEHLAHPFRSHEGGDDNQPLDLSIHSNRNEQALSRTISSEHTALCMVKSCTCHTTSPQSHHLPQYSTAGQAVTRSPNPGTAMCSPSTVQHQASVSAHNSCSSSAAAFPRHIPQPSPWPAAQHSSFQQLTRSDSGCHSTSDLIRPSGDHIDQDTNIHLPGQQRLSMLKRHMDVAGDEDEPTYMDLDSSSARPGIRTGSSSHMYGKPNVQQTVAARNSMEAWLEALPSPHESALLQAHTMGGSLASSEVKTAACFIGGVISHTSLETSRKVRSPPAIGSPSSERGGIHNGSPSSERGGSHNRSPSSERGGSHNGSPSSERGGSHNGSPSSERGGSHNGSPCSQRGGSHNDYSQNQIYSSHSSSLFYSDSHPAPPNRAISAGTPYHRLQQSHPPATFCPSASTFGNPSPTDGFVYAKSQSPHGRCQREQTDSESLLDTSCTSECDSNISGSSPSSGRRGTISGSSPSSGRRGNISGSSPSSGRRSNISGSSPSSGTNSFHMPALRTPSSPHEVTDSQDRLTDEPMDITSMQPATRESAGHGNSTKISLLDFWISKILMERSSEAPVASKPCNVDYICTANGDRKIRLRLVDLMELQVEQSLKA